MVDYKTDRVEPGEDLVAKIASRYGLQQRIYALAALRAGARRVRVVHLYVRAGEAGVVEARWTADDGAALDAEIASSAAAVSAEGPPQVTRDPHRWTCDRCPIRGTLCGWPVELTTRSPGAGEAPAERWSGDPALLHAGPGR